MEKKIGFKDLSLNLKIMIVAAFALTAYMVLATAFWFIYYMFIW